MADRSLFDTIVGLASALNTLIFLALVVVLIPAIYSLARTARDLRAMLDRVYQDMKPLTGHANRIAANLDEISDSVRGEVRDVRDRLKNIGALVDVAQQEAERAFVATASAVEGVRAGAKAAVRGGADTEGDEGESDRGARPRIRPRRKRS